MEAYAAKLLEGDGTQLTYTTGGLEIPCRLLTLLAYIYVALCMPCVKKIIQQKFAALNIRNNKKCHDIYFRNSSGV